MHSTPPKAIATSQAVFFPNANSSTDCSCEAKGSFNASYIELIANNQQLVTHAGDCVNRVVFTGINDPKSTNIAQTIKSYCIIPLF